MPDTICLDGTSLDLQQLRDDARAPRHITLAAQAASRIAATRGAVDRAAQGEPAVYGVNTGFGALASRRIAPSQTEQLQVNLVRSHACGVGAPWHDALVRRMMILKANSLATGYSGVRLQVVEALLALINRAVLPTIPRTGSVGASGDLAPLAHLALALIGEGEATHEGRSLHGAEVMAAAGIAPLRLQAKEGLAILNGTQLSAALAVEGLFAAENLLGAAIATGALTLEALAGSHAPFDARIHAARRQSGQIEVARRFRALLGHTEIEHSHLNCDRVQDPYAVRCMPQVLGALADTVRHAAAVTGAELNAATDNPLVFDAAIISGGNFHAAPLGYVMDFLAIALADCASIAERRIDLLDRKVNPHLNMFLTQEPGLESGFMIAHVTAAALTSSLRTLAHPASVDSIPTSAGQEDHVSMAPWAGEKLLQIAERTATVLAIELLAAAHAIDCMRPLHSSERLEALHALVRQHVPFEAADHRLDRPIAALVPLISGGAVAQFAAG
jgi:histidine ammonia-lyase